MKLKHWIILTLASLVLVACGSEAVKKPIESSAPLATTSAQSVPTESGVQLTDAAKSVVVKVGSFASGEHPTQGTVRVVNQGGKVFLELDRGFKTSTMGPDLVVILHRSSDVLDSTQPPAYPLKAGDYILLAPLQKFSGAQRYAIPTTINLSKYQSAAIWCRKFNATFGAARLINQ